ncbi:MAG: COX15/CtaA family protein [Acidimicrobiales bacterium]
MRLPPISPSAVRKVAFASVIGYALLMITGGAVRLTGSGLGCPDWPSCYHHQLTANVSFHPLVEFVNRLITILITILSGVALLVALARSPRRRDLCWLGGGLVAGVGAQIVLGGIVVLSKLNPYLVACHFLLTIVILADAVVFYHRSGIDAAHRENETASLVPSDLRWLARVLVTTLGVVCTVGTIVAGAGPHAGSPSSPGQPIQRIAIAFRDIAEAHADVAIFLIGLCLASLYAFRRPGLPAVVLQRLYWLFELLVLQGLLGYLQYFLHDNAIIIEFHITGVAGLWIAALAFYLSLHEHPLRDLTPGAAGTSAASARAGSASPVDERDSGRISVSAPPAVTGST